MQNYRFLIAYDRTRYHGWEHKKDVVTIQGKIESVLSLMAGEEVRINGAGRTDAGVQQGQWLQAVRFRQIRHRRRFGII